MNQVRTRRGGQSPLGLERIRADIVDLLGDAGALDAAGGDLIAAGLDSMKVMRLAARWQAAGVPVKFADLFERPTFDQWCELLADQPSPNGTTPVAAIPVDPAAPFPLATMQHAYWVGRDENLVLGGVATHFYAELDGAAIDPDRLAAAGKALAARHGMLRARILPDGRQQILAETYWPEPAVHDLRDLSPAEADVALTRTRDVLSHRRFDVQRGEVFDLQLSLLPDGTSRLHLNIDMLVADALSFRIVVNDLAALYTDPAGALPPIDYSYPQYLADREALPTPGRADAEWYWSQRMRTMPAAPKLPLATAPELLTEHRVTRRHHWLSAGEWAVLARRAAAHGVTLSMVFAAAFSEVLATWSEEPDFLLNVPLFDRKPTHPDVGKLIGDFSNLLILAVHTAPETSFAGIVRRLQVRFTEDVAHAEYSGLDVLRDLGRGYGSAGALAPVVFTSALGMGELFSEDVAKSFGTLGWNISQAPQVWLDHQVTEHSGGLLLNWDALDGLFSPGVLDAMFDAYLRLLSWLAAEPDWAQPTPSLLPGAQQAVRAALNDTAGHPRTVRLHDAFFDRAAAEPERTALAWGTGGRRSYGELATRADRVAGLLAKRGCRRGDVVAVTLPRGPAQAEAVLGVLRAGAVFVPVGPAQPHVRRAAIYAGAGVRLVLTDEATAKAASWPDGVEVVTVEKAEHTEPVTPVLVEPGDLAYVIHTSGSTSEPKGVEMSHCAAVNTIEDLGDRFSVGRDDTGLGVSALDHDWSVYDLFGCLSAGGRLVLLDEQSRRDAQRWAQLVRRWQVTVWTSVPALLDMLLTCAQPGELHSLRLAMVGGDWVPLDQHARLAAQAPGCRLVALGGATEVGIHSTWHEVTEVPPHWRSVPYGAPLRNQLVRVVDQRGRDCPDWVAGELWLGGAGVGEGYRGDPDLTAAKFCTVGGRRWYHTGDLCRFWSDGTLELLGRTDFQVKLLGQRIDLGEIEAALRAEPGVSRAVALVVAAAAGAHLAAAVVPSGAGVTPEGLVARLRERLPDHLVPRQIGLLDALPLTANGKINRAAIAASLAEMYQPTAVDPPRGPMEERLAEIWSRLLGTPSVSRSDSFFSLGGNSLLATQLMAQLGAEGLAGGSLSQLFATPALGEFAAYLRAGAARGPELVVSPDPAHRHDPFPATDVQRAYWLGRRPEFALGGVGSHWYWEFDGTGVNLARLERAWNRLVQRHEMLRAVFDDDGQQRILREVPPFRITVTTAGDDAGRELAALRDRMAHRCYDPGTWPLFNIQAVRHGDDRTRIGLSLDFLVLDALSIMIVFGELATLYADERAELPPVGVFFRDIVLAEPADSAREQAAREYWLGRVDRLPAAPQVPLSGDLARRSGHRFSRRQFRLADPDWQAIVAKAATYGVTPSTVVATAFATVLQAWSASPRFTLNVTLFDRPAVHPDIHRVVGDFTSLLLVANEPETGEGFADAARRLQGQIWADMEHSAFSGVAVLRELAKRTGSVDIPMPVVLTSTLGVGAVADGGFDLAMPFGDYVTGLSQTPQVWLDHQVTEDAGGLLLNWDAVDEVFPSGLLDAMLDGYRELLGRLAAEADWSRPVRPPLPAAQAAVRERVNDTAAPQSGRLLHDGFLVCAEADPARVAVIGRDAQEIDYGTLAHRARCVAGALQAAGVRPGDRVAVTLPMGPAQIEAVLGVLGCGGVYVPVGTDQPDVRRARILRDSGARALVVAAGADQLGLPDGVQAVQIDEARGHAPGDLARAAAADAAYVIYTSGSTGDPKGVAVSHASAVNTVEDIVDRFGVGADDRVLAVSALDFDLSVFDVFGLLAAGGTVVMIGDEDRRDAAAWLDLVRWHRVTLWNTVPALLDMLLVAADGELPASLRLAMVSGDWVGLDLPGRLADASGSRCRLVALGGATEAAIWSNAFEVDRVDPAWTSIPYGFPLRNQRFRVVGRDGADRPDWVPGELWIGGAGVALGYHGDPERTADRFVEHEGQRWYRTGDLGRYWPDGTLEFLGRADQQVKVRGHRIELGEIEAALEAHPGVDAAVVCALGDRVRRLAAAVVTRDHASDGFAAFLADRLPEYMIPQRFAVVDRLPLTANGKVDRAAVARVLAEQAGSGDSPAAQPPRGEVERLVAGLWADLLGMPVEDRLLSFFAAGGDSLLATRLVQSIRRELGVDVSLRNVLTAPTVAGQAEFVKRQLVERAGAVEEGAL